MFFPFVESFPLAVLILWVVFFFGGAVMPPATGIMISAIPRPIRAFGSSTAQLFQNLLGYLPSPFLYGLVKNSTQSARTAMTCLMLWSCFGVWGLYSAYKYQQDQLQSKSRKNYIDFTAQQEAKQKRKAQERLDRDLATGKIAIKPQSIELEDFEDYGDTSTREGRGIKIGKKGIFGAFGKSDSENVPKLSKKGSQIIESSDQSDKVHNLKQMYVDINRLSNRDSLLNMFSAWTSGKKGD